MVSLVGNVVNLAQQIVRVVAIKLMEPVPMGASLVSMEIGVTNLAQLIVIQLNVSKPLDIAWVNANPDSMVTIATAPAQQIVIPWNVFRPLATAMRVVLLVSMVINAHKSALRIV